MSNVQVQINDLSANIQALETSLTNVTGNTLSNYNQLSRIVAQQGNIYNAVYYGTGNISTGNLTVNTTANVVGNLRVNGTATFSGSLFNAASMNLNTMAFTQLSQNGYMRFGNIMIQWGNVGDSTTTQTASFNPDFTSTPYCAFIQRADVVGGGSADNGATVVKTISSTTMTFDTVFGSTDKSAAYWFAIGPYTA